MLTSTILFYLLAGGVVTAGLLFVRRGRGPGRVILWSGSAVVLAALVLTAAFGEGPFGLMRLAAHGIFGILPFALLVGSVLEGRSWRRAAAVFSAALLWATALYAFRIEPRRLEVTSHRVESEAVSGAIRLVALADLQTERIGQYEAEVLRRMAALQPDLVLLPGDYLQISDESEYLRQAGRLRETWRSAGLDPPLGGFAVAGNTDLADLWPGIFEGIPVRPLAQTTTLRVGELSVTALSASDSADSRLRVDEAPGFHVVFGHHPDFALGRIEADLLLAGHTHGGQVRLPGLGPIITLSRVPRSWAAGRTELSHGRTLVVSRGVGMERGFAPRLRFLCRPELVVVDVVPVGAPRSVSRGLSSAVRRR